VGLRFGTDRRTARRWDNDQSFISGDTRHLRDEDGDRSLDLDASINFAWDFGDTAYDPEYVDLSRESRLVIALRDDVLDEVNQLYFERLGLLRQLARPPDELPPTAGAGEGAAPDRLRLELRVGELTAGLDAWTGGWFSRQLQTGENASGPG
jgi:hypothetical protein